VAKSKKFPCPQCGVFPTLNPSTFLPATILFLFDLIDLMNFHLFSAFKKKVFICFIIFLIVGRYR